MVEDTMFSGESKNIEYKVSLPDKSEKYMKTIVAFANTQGGKLIVGVDDKTHQIVGVENDVLFQLMDGIANAVSDSCVPQIIPDIEPQTVNGETVIVVSVEAGKNRPYYLKSKGKDNGTYIRVAGTSRQAFSEKIKELEMEGARISWDELTCIPFTASYQRIHHPQKSLMGCGKAVRGFARDKGNNGWSVPLMARRHNKRCSKALHPSG